MPFNIKFVHTANSSRQALCDTCRYSQIVRGSNGEQLIACRQLTRGGDVAPVKFKVTECSAYISVNGQELWEMRDIAWLLGTKKIVGLAGGTSDETVITWSKPSDRNGQNEPSS